MKKLVLLSALFLLLFVLTLGTAFADMQMEDPVLCVAGQWLTVDAVAVGHQDAVTVILPANTPYGDSTGCSANPAARIENVAVRQSNSPIMQVEVNGEYATPVVTTSYDGKTFHKANNGKRVLNFQFNLH